MKKAYGWTDVHELREIAEDENFERAPGTVAIMREFAQDYRGSTKILQFGVGSFCDVFGRDKSASLRRAILRTTGHRMPNIQRRNHSTLVLAETREGSFNGVRPYLRRQLFLRPLIMAEDLETYQSEVALRAYQQELTPRGLYLVCNPDLDVDKVREIASHHKPQLKGNNWEVSPAKHRQDDWDHWYAVALSRVNK